MSKQKYLKLFIRSCWILMFLTQQWQVDSEAGRIIIHFNYFLALLETLDYSYLHTKLLTISLVSLDESLLRDTWKFFLIWNSLSCSCWFSPNLSLNSYSCCVGCSLFLPIWGCSSSTFSLICLSCASALVDEFLRNCWIYASLDSSYRILPALLLFSILFLNDFKY